MRNEINEDFLKKLYAVIQKRAKGKNKNSYTKTLIKKGKNTIAQKIGEEASELIIEYLNGTKKRTTEEACDLIYHMLVLLYSKKITIGEINKELTRRRNVRQ